MKTTYCSIFGKGDVLSLNWFEKIVLRKILQKNGYKINEGDKYSKKYIKVTEWLCDCLLGKKKFK